MLTTLRPINRPCYEKGQVYRPWSDPLVPPKQWKRDVEFKDPVEVRVKTVARELVRYKLALVGVQEVRWDKGIIQEQEIFFMGDGTKIINCKESFLQHRILSAVRRVEFVSDRVSYRVLRGRWSNIFLNVHASSEKKGDDLKTVFRRN